MTTLVDAGLSPLLRGFEIPPCPAVLNDLRRELDSDDCDPRRVAQLISRDVGLSAAVIRVANSPALALQRKAKTIGEALSLLGSRQILNLVVGELLKRLVSQENSPSLERFWDRAALSAAVCARLSGRLRGSQRDTAYCFGLFRDCGIPLMMQRFPDYKTTLQLANRASTSFTDVEDSRHGVDHAVIGYLLARSWNLSANLCAAMRSHHEFSALYQESDSGLSVESSTLIGIGVVAERIISLSQNASEENEWRLGRDAVSHFFSLGEGELDDIVDDELEHLRACND
ncbi:HDOD domain-containing protein [Rhodocyclus tenuis]|uniref:HDOD domain-containing protein n=1 Tax=Rhodocyclus gracilis TaxID=2929842 RepID=A0ABX0WMJ5_9RHOO|nr:HDOD domain-containing protein [Rhodocyclus gracilis]MRD74035.1 HDOD domain-containing protein [Rhodocyclus gracilis]NJA89956.1 HDOD domain-containing protein [Rhodocyclus gracilis]